MRILKSKRGVSPLIATILLIAFAVALGAVVMQLGTSMVGESCAADIQLSTSDVCFDGKMVNVGLGNAGEAPIAGASVWVHGTKEGIKTKNLGEPLQPNIGVNMKIAYDQTLYGDVAKIEIIPKFKSDDELVSCEGAKIEIEEVPKC